ncbi:MAG: LysE family translocator [Bacteroidota bacterium]
MLSALLVATKVEVSTLVSFAAATALLALSPGPDNIFVISQSLTNGIKSGMATVCGLISGCLVHTTLLAFGVSEIIKRSEHLFWTIKIFGIVYLLYLAFKVWKSDGAIVLSDAESQPTRSLPSLFKTGFIMNVLNPKVTIFFLAFFPGFLFSQTYGTVFQFYVLGLLFMAISFAVFSVLALLAGYLSKLLLRNKTMGQYLKALQIITFLSIALYLALSGK